MNTKLISTILLTITPISAIAASCNHDTDPRLTLVNEEILTVAVCGSNGTMTDKQAEQWWDEFALALEVTGEHMFDHFSQQLAHEFAAILADEELSSLWSPEYCTHAQKNLHTENVTRFHAAIELIGNEKWVYSGPYSSHKHDVTGRSTQNVYMEQYLNSRQ
ncbi:hypothetical protein F0231_10740 [Vibrio sp. RE86]|uniref:hypothetical protein n=1 Tax=Vibrio sp. RE86 TaxID=2607605 RepID=UPI001493B045|nr:hypothetical protein [Vibrio sp. RE86]NOH80211.1 hypothetical protein [Vibrio sp. RE86]